MAISGCIRRKPDGPCGKTSHPGFNYCKKCAQELGLLNEETERTRSTMSAGRPVKKAAKKPLKKAAKRPAKKAAKKAAR